MGDVLAGEGRAWIFVAKSLLAIYLAAWLAMWLRLERPSTSMITVAIVMHPHSGMVLAKSFYRTLGTLAGSAAGLALLAAFPQQRELFLASLSVWVALCSGGALLYRNFMAYGFLLAGYTAAIVTLPVIGQPLHVFDSAVMRVSEVLLGIAVAGVVSDLVLPERLRAVLRHGARERFVQFVDFVRGSTGGGIDRAQMERAHLAAVRAVVQLEDLRASVAFEDPEARARSLRVRLLNQRYMAASTSFHSLHHLINRLYRAGRTQVGEALVALNRPVGEALAPVDPSQQYEPAVLAARLDETVARLPGLAMQLRAPLADPDAQLEFDAGAALTRRFAGEIHAFSTMQAALRSGRRLGGSVERVHFRRGNDLAGAGVAWLRTFLTMAALSALWLASGWAFGASAMLLATIFSGLLAGSPTPVAAATRTLHGYAAGMMAAFVVVFGLLPGSNSFPMLICASAPLLAIGPYLSTRAGLPGVGAGYTLGFVYILALNNPMAYDPVRFLNDAVAQLVGLALSGVAFVVVPAVTGTGWQRRRQLRRLREQVALAASAPLAGLSHRFESVSRDLFQQVVGHTRPGSAESRDLLAWALAVQETGRAVIELRQDLASGTLRGQARAAADAAVQAVAWLYRAPDAPAWRAADRAVAQAIDATAHAPAVRNHLFQLRTALRDEDSPVGERASNEPPETANAA